MSLTLTDKFAVLHAAEDTVRKARADLVDATTGEAIPPGEFRQDGATGAIWLNDKGTPTRLKVPVVPAKS